MPHIAADGASWLNKRANIGVCQRRLTWTGCIAILQLQVSHYYLAWVLSLDLQVSQLHRIQVLGLAFVGRRRQNTVTCNSSPPMSPPVRSAVRRQLHVSRPALAASDKYVLEKAGSCRTGAANATATPPVTHCNGAHCTALLPPTVPRQEQCSTADL